MASGEDIQHAWLDHVRGMGLDARQKHLDAQATPAIWRFWLGDVIDPDVHAYLPEGARLGPDLLDRQGRPWAFRSADGRSLHDWMRSTGRLKD
jgi:hypothetical protein